MHTSTVKVLRGPLTFGGWKAQLVLDGDTMTIEGHDSTRSMVVSLNGGRLWLQSSGGLLSADRTPAGHQTNQLIGERLAQHNVRVFGV